MRARRGLFSRCRDMFTSWSMMVSRPPAQSESRRVHLSGRFSWARMWASPSTSSRPFDAKSKAGPR